MLEFLFKLNLTYLSNLRIIKIIRIKVLNIPTINFSFDNL